MHKYLKTIVFIGGAFAGVVTLLGIQSLAGNNGVAAALQNQTASAVVRNYGLLAIGLVGIVTAIIRLSMADTQQRQDKRSDLFDRFQKSSEMLNSENIAVRQAGLYTLAEIAKEQPNEFYVIVQSLFCGFLRQASVEQWNNEAENIKIQETADCPFEPIAWGPVRADIQDAIELFSKSRKVIKNSVNIEKAAEFKANLRGLYIPGGSFQHIDLTGCDLDTAKLDDAAFVAVTFNGVSLVGASMKRTQFWSCQLKDLFVNYTDMRWAFFSGGVLSVAVDGPVKLDATLADDLEFEGDIFDALSPEPVTGEIKKFPHYTQPFERGEALHAMRTRMHSDTKS